MDRDAKLILIIGDEPVAAQQEYTALKQEGYEVIIASSGETGVSSFESAAESIDLVLIDIELGPGMDGIEAAERILRIRDVPILFGASRPERETVERAESVAPYGFVAKNSGEAILSASLKAALRLHEEKRKAEEILHESEELFSAFMEKSPIYVFFKDEQIRSLKLSQNYEAMLGKPMDELLGKTMDELFPSDLAKSMIADDMEILRKGDPVLITEEMAGRVYETLKFPIPRKGRPSFLAGFTMDVTRRVEIEKALERSIKEKEILLKELQHRVKNSLNIVASLLGLEMDKVADEEARGVFLDLRSRIVSISTMYEELNRSSSYDSVDLESYLVDLSKKIFDGFGADGSRISFKTEIDSVRLDLKRAIPIGLIVNELLINSFKYAFPCGRNGSISLVLAREGGNLSLSIEDDGIGLPQGFVPSKSETMGMLLLHMLSDQIGAEIRIVSQGGVKAKVSLPFAQSSGLT